MKTGIACVLEPESETKSNTIVDKEDLNSKLKKGNMTMEQQRREPEPEPSNVMHSQNRNPEPSNVMDSQNRDPGPSNAVDSRTLDVENNTTHDGVLHRTSYRNQADALFRKNLTYQVRCRKFIEFASIENPKYIVIL